MNTLHGETTGVCLHDPCPEHSDGTDWQARRERAARQTLENGGGTFRNGTFEPVPYYKHECSAYGPCDAYGEDEKYTQHAHYAVAVARGYARPDRGQPMQRGFGSIGWPTVQAVAYALDGVRAYNDSPYIGTWVNPRGDVVIDPVIILPDRESAIILARAFGQEAIWNFETGEEIKVD